MSRRTVMSRFMPHCIFFSLLTFALLSSSVRRVTTLWTQTGILTTSCKLIKIGGRASDGYGSWTLCASSEPVKSVLSGGVGGDVSFEVELAKTGDTQVYCFDPTVTEDEFRNLVKSSDHQKQLRFYAFGVGGSDGILPLFKSNDPTIGSLVSTPGTPGYATEPHVKAPILRISTLLGLMNPYSPTVLKLDVEGAEFDIFDGRDSALLSFLSHGTLSQIAIEFHDRLNPQSNRSRVIAVLGRCGYEVRHVSDSDEEVLFVRTRRVKNC